MKVHTHARILVCGFLVAVFAQSANAQADGQPQAATNPPSVLITPFFAFGDDLAPGGGGAFTFPWTGQLSVEMEASLGTDAARSSVNLLYDMPRLGRFTPYLAGGIGVQRDEIDSNLASVDFNRPKTTEFAVNVGAGATISIGDRWSYRADFRWYNPDNEWPESWRVFSGVTLAFRR
jgi:opacity protein-like surface antigen